MKIVFTGGGTGGHVYPNIAIYEAIKEKYPESSFLYVGTKKGAESRIVRNIPQPIEFVDVPSKGLPQSLKSFKTLIALFFIFLGTIKSFFILRKFKPDLIIGSGGYVAAPVLFAAYFLKIKSFIHEQNAVPGRLNQFIARFAARVGVSFSSTSNFFPEDKVSVTGYPLRKSIRLNDRTIDVKAKYKIPEKNKVVFIFGGSGGSRTINNAVAEIVPMLMSIPDLTIILSTGRGYSAEYKAFEDTVKVFEDIGVPSEIEGRLIIREYFDNIDEIYSITDLIVSRAGAGTIKEITTIGIPCILIPKIDLPGDHQIMNAREIEKIGGAKIVYEAITFKNNKQMIFVPEENLLKTIKETLFDSDILFNMRKNLRKIEKHNSTDLILKELESLLSGVKKTAESQLKVFYLQPAKSEKSIELVFDSTTVGTSLLCDAYLEGIDEDTLIEIKLLKPESNEKQDERIVIKRLKGILRVDGTDIETWAELKEDSLIEIGSNRDEYVLKSYFEKVKKVTVTRSTSFLTKALSPGILCSRIGGVFREIFVAGYFGASLITDIYSAALTVAHLMRRIVAEYALENAFLPIFSQYFGRASRKKTWDAASSVFTFTILLSILSTGLLLVFSPIIIKTVFPGFVERGLVSQASGVTQVILPYMFLMTISAVMIVYLKAFGRYGAPEASYAFFSIGTILGIIIYFTKAGLYSLAYGVLLGGILQVLFLLPFAWKLSKNQSLQFQYSPMLNFKGPFSKKYYSQLGSISVDVILSRATDLVGKFLASRIAEGVLAFLHFSLAIFQLPFAIISQSVNTKVLKEFTSKTALFDKKKSKQLILDGIRINLFMLVPISILIVFLAKPLVAVLFERGNFGSRDVIGTSFALQFYALGLVGWGLHTFTVRIFAMRMENRTSLLLSVLMAAMNIGLSIWLVQTPLSFKGLALATSLSFSLFSVIRILVLKKKLGKENILLLWSDLFSTFLKTFLASLLMIIILIHAKFLLNNMTFTSKFMHNVILLIALSFIGFSVYFLASLMLKNAGLMIFKKKGKKAGEVPASMLSPFKFLERVSKDTDSYREDYFYKINIYLFSSRWEVRNIGIKLIGLFNDTSKVDYLVNLLKFKKLNGFMRRNAVQALKALNVWNTEIKSLFKDLMLHDTYYEVRAGVIEYLVKCCPPKDYPVYKNDIHRCLKSKKSTLEEKLWCLRTIAKFGDKEEFNDLEALLLYSSSLIREELLELLYTYYRRKVFTGDELKEFIGKILITSNNMNPEFKLKTIIKKIYKEIE